MVNVTCNSTFPIKPRSFILIFNFLKWRFVVSNEIVLSLKILPISLTTQSTSDCEISSVSKSISNLLSIIVTASISIFCTNSSAFSVFHNFIWTVLTVSVEILGWSFLKFTFRFIDNSQCASEYKLLNSKILKFCFYIYTLKVFRPGLAKYLWCGNMEAWGTKSASSH